MRRGDVWWHKSPRAQRRPVVILTSDEVIPHLNHLVAAPPTTRIRSIPTEVELGLADGMPKTCVVSLDNTLSIRPTHLVEFIARLEHARMSEVCAAWARSLAC